MWHRCGHTRLPLLTVIAMLWAVIAMLWGCTATSPLPSTVQVRAASDGSPLHGAVVAHEANTLFAPFSQVTAGLAPGSTIGPVPDPARGQVRTGPDGRAAVVLASNRPNHLVVHAAGYDTLHVIVEADATTIVRPIGWTRGPAAPAGRLDDTRARLEVQVQSAHGAQEHPDAS